MTKCIRCNVLVDIQHSHCPLCFSPLKNEGESLTAYPQYELFYQHAKSFTWGKLLKFMTIAAIIISITINLLTLHLNPNLWSAIVTMGLLYSWVAMKGTILSKKHIGKKVLNHYMTLSIFLLVIDICVGFEMWSTNYAIPLFGVAATFVMTIIAIVQKSLWQDDIGYLLAMFFVNLCPLLLFFFQLSNVIWTSVMTIVYSLLTIIGMIIFSDRKFKSELNKRFHF